LINHGEYPNQKIIFLFIYNIFINLKERNTI